ncbi:bifunctional non-homologous end joining protein LigD [Scopulibacillus daqui]|uniref:DNA ligase (ATP) n=1 Tax=Scopulibacillus daqui TaxID=1469162 RepID=A0ABS2PVA2_9BACL|nr:RNA ligase family protein [Scopulibacillus daqui]MBM7643983.1 bifunctional non-homologous end joining protein LigD [Scopulibacillus daqui]
MNIKPFIPFEPVRTDEIPEGDQWISQVKWDGVRILTYSDGKNVRLFNRKLNERTFHYPELLAIKSYCKEKSVILDGEVIALGDDGKPSFHEVMRRDGIRKLERINELRKEVPVSYMIFDVIYCKDEWKNDLALKDRLDLLKQIIIPNEHIQIVPSQSDGNTLFEVIKQQELEGIVIKDLNSKYLINGKDNRWQKKKNYRDIIAVAGGATMRQGVVNALILGLYNEDGRLMYVGHAGTGKLKKAEWKELTERVKPLMINHCPFINKPLRIKEAIWLEPRITVKIKFIEWTKDKHLRQPSIQAFVNMSPEECLFE